MISSCTEPKLFICLFQQSVRFCCHNTVFFQISSVKLSVKTKFLFLVTFSLNLLDSFYSFPYFCGRLSWCPFLHLRKTHRRNFCADIYAFQKWLADFPQIMRDLSRSTAASVHIRIKSAGAGIHCCCQHKTRRKRIGSCRSGQMDFLIFQGLTQDLQALS